MAKRLTKSNPGFLSDQELAESFCVRMVDLQLIVNVLRESTGNSNPHLIVIGARGSGKTTLLLRVSVEVKRDPSLCSKWFPIIFPEENYGIATCGEFWLQCLASLADQAPRMPEAPDLHLTLQELQEVQDDRTLADRCLAKVLDFADSEGKRLFLIVENLNTMFDEIRDPDFGWQLRKTLQDEPRIFLMGSATSRFNEIDNSSRALYDFFQIHTLNPLNTASCATLWTSVAKKDVEQRSIRSLEILTGGNPRLIATLAQFGVRLSFHSLMSDLLGLVDDNTEYFRSHLKSIPPQERRVYVSLVALWKPATAKQVAVGARLPTSQCSSLLRRLVGRGIVSRVGGTQWRREYYPAERMCSIYYLLRRDRGKNRAVKALVSFMKSYYSERRGIQIRTSGETTILDKALWPMRQVAFRQLSLSVRPNDRAIQTEKAMLATKPMIDDVGPSLNRSEIGPAAKSVDDTLPDTAALVGRARQLLENKCYKQAMEVCERCEVNLNQNRCARSVELKVGVLLIKAISLDRLGCREDSINVINEASTYFDDADSPRMVKMLGELYVLKVRLLVQAKRPAEVLDVCEAFEDRFDASPRLATDSQRAEVLLAKSMALMKIDRLHDAATILDQLIRRYESHDSVEVQESVARALLGRGELLEKANYLEEACIAFDALSDRFGSNDTPDIVVIVATSMLRKGIVLWNDGRFNEASNLYKRTALFLNLYRPYPASGLAYIADIYWANSLDILGQPIEARARYDAVIARSIQQNTDTMDEISVTALVNMANSLVRSNQTKEAVDVYRTAVHQFCDRESKCIVEKVQWALIGKGACELTIGRIEAAIESTGKVLLGKVVSVSKIDIIARLLRAEAFIESGDDVALKLELSTMLKLLPSFESVPQIAIDGLMAFAVRLGFARVLDLIEKSSSRVILLPLLTALRLELGVGSRVAKEVDEVAGDIREHLDRLRDLAGS